MPAKDYKPAITKPAKLAPVALPGFSGEYSDAGHQHPTTGVAAAVIDTVAADISTITTAAQTALAGAKGLASDAGHQHPHATFTSVTIDTNAADISTIAQTAQTAGAGATGLAADAGHIHPHSTFAAMSTTAKARAHSTANQAFSSEVDTVVTLGTVDYDPGANFASNAFTAPVAGWYQVNVHAQSQNPATAYVLRLRLSKNGTVFVTWSDFNVPVGIFQGGTGSDIVQLAASDVLRFVIKNSAASTIVAAFMSVHLLSI